VHADKNLEAAFVSVVSDGQRLFSAFEKPNFGFEDKMTSSCIPIESSLDFQWDQEKE